MWTESKPPQLDRAELEQLRWLFGTLLVLIAAWTVPYMGIDAWFWLALITGVALLIIWRPQLTVRLPRWAHRLAFPLFLALGVADWQIQTNRVLPALVRLTLMLLLYRLSTARRRREDLQVIVLGLFLVVVAGVLSVSVVFVAQILIFTACALGLLLMLTLADAEQGAQGAQAPQEWPRVSWRELARSVRAVTHWRLVLVGAGLFGGLVALSLMFFLFLPRFDLEGTLFFDHLMQGKSRTGFSDEVKLGDVTDIEQDNSVAFNVVVSDPAQIPEEANLYWRMLVLDEYENGRFSMSATLTDSLVVTALTGENPRYPGPASGQTDAPVWTFFVEPGISRYLPLPGSFREIIFTEPQKLSGNSELRILALPHSPIQMLPYRMEQLDLSSNLPAPSGAAAPAKDDPSAPWRPAKEAAGAVPRAQPAYLSLGDKMDSADQAKLADWAKGLQSTPDDATAFALRACAWLDSQHSYAMKVTLPAEGETGTDPIVRWMSGKEDGHCEFFAGAFVLLARAAGYPTRLAVGFKGGSWNPFSENLTVRNLNAHAWCEILDTKRGVWVRADPTPGSEQPGFNLEPRRGEAVLKAMRDNSLLARFDSLRVFWYEHIVSFDQTKQLNLGHTSRLVAEELGRRVKEFLKGEIKAGKEWLARPWDRFRLARCGVAAALLLAGAWWWRIGTHAWQRWRGADPVRRTAGRWLARWERRGLTVQNVEVRNSLWRLRYGAQKSRPDPAKVFRAARREWRLARTR